MPHDRLNAVLSGAVGELEQAGTAKGAEKVISGVIPATEERGPRYLLADEGERPFLKMNSNNYLGMALRPEVIEAEERASAEFGVGPGAVRFISGSHRQHIELEERLAAFHSRKAAMIFSSAYATTLGVLVPLASAETTLVSDELNHNCIINAMRLARPQEKKIYGHLDMGELDSALASGDGKRAVVVTDGIFSMRGSSAPLAEIIDLARKYDDKYPENVVVVVDDSHGIGAFGETGRGTEEYEGVQADAVVGTLGKALGVNGGYVAGSAELIAFLRETAATYIYSNPITAGEAAAACKALEILDSDEGGGLLAHLRAMAQRFTDGLNELGFETIAGEHPVTPLMVRDTQRTTELVQHLYDNRILATGLNYPVVPKGDQSIRFQVSAEHTGADIDEVLDILASLPG